MKNERLKKLESELGDLENWLELGLVPKKDLQKHEGEIQAIRKKIHEEKEKLAYLKETGEYEEYSAPKRSKEQRSALDAPTISDSSASGDETEEADLEVETGSGYSSDTTGWGDDGDEDDKTLADEEDDEDPFSDRNRWRRGILDDPDSNNW